MPICKFTNICSKCELKNCEKCENNYETKQDFFKLSEKKKSALGSGAMLKSNE